MNLLNGYPNNKKSSIMIRIEIIIDKILNISLKINILTNQKISIQEMSNKTMIKTIAMIEVMSIITGIEITNRISTRIRAGVIMTNTLMRNMMIHMIRIMIGHKAQTIPKEDQGAEEEAAEEDTVAVTTRVMTKTKIGITNTNQTSTSQGKAMTGAIYQRIHCSTIRILKFLRLRKSWMLDTRHTCLGSAPEFTARQLHQTRWAGSIRITK